MIGLGTPVVALLFNVSSRTPYLAAATHFIHRMLQKILNYRCIRMDYNGFGSPIY